MLAALLSAACRHQSDSVVSNQTPAPAPAAALPAPAQTATPQAAAQPVGPTGPSPQASPAGTRKGPSITSFPVTRIEGRPSPSPTREIKPKPAPPPVVVDGKIVQQWQAPPEAAKLVNPVKGQKDAAEIGRAYYMQRCVDCHGKEGRGNGQLSQTIKKPPTDLTSAMVQANTDGELFWKITNGRSPMPANKIRFEDEQRWYIVTFLRTLK